MSQRPKKTTAPARSVTLLRLPSGRYRFERGSIVANPGLDRAAAVFEDDDRMLRVLASGSVGPPHESVRGLKISVNGEGVAYAFRRAGFEWASINGQEIGPFDDVQSAFFFSPDGTTASWLATVGGEWRLHVGLSVVRSGPDDAEAAQLGYPDPSFAGLEETRRPFPPCALTQQAAHAPENEVESPDGERVVRFYLNKLKGVWIVEDGPKTREFQAISKPAFSADSKRLVYWATPRARDPAGELLLCNHEPVLEAPQIGFHDPDHFFCFDLSGVRVLSRFRTAQGWRLFLDGRETAAADWCSDPHLMPEGPKLMGALAARGSDLCAEFYDLRNALA